MQKIKIRKYKSKQENRNKKSRTTYFQKNTLKRKRNASTKNGDGEKVKSLKKIVLVLKYRRRFVE